MRLAPDNKIYISTSEGSNIFHVINSPDSAGLNCNLTQHNFILPQYNDFSMPNVPNYALGALTGSICDSLVGVENIEKENPVFIIYPNPAFNKISIMMSDDFTLLGSSQLVIYNSLGSIVLRKKIITELDLLNIDIHELLNGIYYSKLYVNNKNYNAGRICVIH
jgi:hypothetical protein